MKITLTLSNFQLMKALALTPATEEQSEKSHVRSSRNSGN